MASYKATIGTEWVHVECLIICQTNKPKVYNNSVMKFIFLDLEICTYQELISVSGEFVDFMIESCSQVSSVEKSGMCCS